MPSIGPRKHLFKKISGRIAKINKISFSKGLRRYNAFLHSQLEEYTSQRYISRPTRYKPIRYEDTIDNLLNSPTSAFRFLFRVTRTEFYRLVNRLEGYESLHRMGTVGRLPAPVRYQVALFLYRLAHSHEVKAISRLFGISEGSVVKWSDNVCEAIQSLWNDLVTWPTPRERHKIKDNLLARYGIPDCLGFIDGILIPFNKAPARPGKSAGSFFTRKGTYALAVMAVVDHRKRFRLVHYGHTGATNDQTVQRDLPFTEAPEDFFDDEEHIIGDGGMTCTPRVLAMCKRDKGRPHLHGLNAYFNYKAAPARVNIEHTFGILKARWNSLTDLRLTFKELQDERRAYGWIKSAIILHNMFVSTWQDVLNEEAVQKMMRTATELRGRDHGDMDQSQLASSYRRREEVAKQMLRMEEEGQRPNMDTFWI